MSSPGVLPFKNIPANWRLPLFFVEFDNSMANVVQNAQPTLLIGQSLPAGTAAAGVAVLCQSRADAMGKFGVGSMLADMVDAYLSNDESGQVWCLPLADDGASAKAAGSLNFTQAATAGGTLNLYIAGTRVAMAVASTQTTAQLATALAAAINANPNLPVTAVVDGVTTTKVNITANQGGLVGNDIDLRVNYGGAPAGEYTPTGLTFAIVALSGGTTNPSTGLNTALGNVGDQAFDFIISPYTDSTSLNDIQAFLNDTTGRWSYQQLIYGHHFTALRGTNSALATAGAARNNQHETILGFYDSPTPCWRVACQLGGPSAVALRADPGRPLQTLVMQGFQASPLASRFTMAEREALVYSGISTFTTGDDGTSRLEEIITTYQKNAFNQADTSYLQVETMFQLMFLMRNLAGFVTSKYARFKLAADGTRLAPGAGVATPAIVRQDIIARYAQLCYEGFAQNLEGFSQGIIVELDPTNANRLNVLWPGTLMDQLRVFATLAQFRLQ